VKVRAIIKLIEADGWEHVTTRGSHRQYRHPIKPGRVTVPGKPSFWASSETVRFDTRRLSAGPDLRGPS